MLTHVPFALTTVLSGLRRTKADWQIACCCLWWVQ